MEMKKYRKPQINVIAIDAVGIMAGSDKETIPIGKPGSGNVSTPKPKAFNIKTKCIYKNFLLYYRTEGSFCIF